MGVKTILVTGGAGFIGSHLCARLISLGHRVISLDNYFTGSRDNHVAGVEYREGHTKDVEKLVPEKIDLVFHLGEYARVEKSMEEPNIVWDLNKAGTFAVLEFCRKRGCKIVYAGSSTKFSDGGLGRDLTPYTWTKATNTEIVKNYGQWYGLPFAITYFYNVYGPGEISNGPYSTLIGIFMQEFRRGQPLTVVSPGTQVRNFTHVDDIVDGLILVGEKGQGDEHGIGAAEAYSILDVAHLFGGEIMMLPERKGNRMDSVVNTSKVTALGWQQKHKLSDYIQSFVQETKREAGLEKRVLVFSTTFDPVAGPAEKALAELMRRMPDVHFDVITTAYSPEAKNAPSPLENATVYRVGYGRQSDKYLLPILGARKAKELASQHKYLFVWSVLASYAALTAMVLRRDVRLPLLVSLADQKFQKVPWHLRFLLGIILKNADQVSASASDQEVFASRFKPRVSNFATNRTGDVFANQIRFAYNTILKERKAI
jgi:UDP-glucose 4-epimerase